MNHAVLFVCTANICRSPMAEVVLRTMSARRSAAASLRIGSAGTHHYHEGMPAFPAALEVAKRRGYDVTRHVARVVTPGDLERFDLILAMDRSNLASLRAMAPTRAKDKLELLLEYGQRYHGQEISDPYGGEIADFERALDMIEDGCRGLVQVLLR